MAKARSTYRCTECGCDVAKWVGQCPECQAWGTIDMAGSADTPTLSAGPVTQKARRIAEISETDAAAVPTGVSELDRVLGKGLVTGACVLLAGEPGVGKSTLLLEVAHRFASHNETPALIVTGEESAGQVRLRASRTGAECDQLYLAAETDLSALLTHVDDVKPSLLIVDSVQTIGSRDADGSPGGVTQVRAVASSLVALAKQRGISTVIVGHVTKDGGIAGPRVLEHLVDVVLHFEGDEHSTLRMLRAVKNRFGPADEVGCFEMFDGGIRSVIDPSGLFTSERIEPVAGTCLTVTLQGRRPLIAEMQALVTSSVLSNPRRAVSGLDSSRLAMVLAVTSRRAGVRLGESDVYASSVGGVRLTEPAADLALALAIASAAADKPLGDRVAALGEVALSGELRRVSGAERRAAEAARMGVESIIVPTGSLGSTPPGEARIVEVGSLPEALRRVF